MGGMVGQSLVDTGLGMGGRAPSAQTNGVGYTPAPTSPTYVPSYNPTPAASNLQSVLGLQPTPAPTNSLGLPSLQSMFNLPQRGPNPQAGGIQQLTPMQPYIGSTYRPNMAAINANLNNVAPSVALQQKRAAEEEARRRAEEDAYNAAHPQSNPYDYGGGG